jgi:hypothetical protein
LSQNREGICSFPKFERCCKNALYLTRFLVIWNPLENPHEISTDPWGFNHIPIPIPYPYPWESPWESPHPRQPCVYNSWSNDIEPGFSGDRSDYSRDRSAGCQDCARSIAFGKCLLEEFIIGAKHLHNNPTKVHALYKRIQLGLNQPQESEKNYRPSSIKAYKKPDLTFTRRDRHCEQTESMFRRTNRRCRPNGRL